MGKKLKCCSIDGGVVPLSKYVTGSSEIAGGVRQNDSCALLLTVVFYMGERKEYLSNKTPLGLLDVNFHLLHFYFPTIQEGSQLMVSI